MENGNVGVKLEGQGDSTVNLHGGTVHGDLLGFNNATINMTGGTVFGRGIFHDTVTFNFKGGTIEGGITTPAPAPNRAAGAAAADAPEPLLLPITARWITARSIRVNRFDLQATLLDPNQDGMFSSYLASGLLRGRHVDCQPCCSTCKTKRSRLGTRACS